MISGLYQCNSVLFEGRTLDISIDERLKALGISLIAEWDVLVFIYRHGTSLSSTEQIARLVGWNKAAVSAALEKLSTAQLIARSPASHGVRLYRFLPVENSPLHTSFQEAMSLTDSRGGRLLLMTALRQRTGTRAESHSHGGLHLA